MSNDGQTKELIKTQLGTYEITKTIATGNFSSVYVGKRESDGKLFAIKCESMKLKASLIRQASMVLASLQYPSPMFLTIIERGMVENRFLLIVTPLYGETLQYLMKTTYSTKRFSTGTGLHLAEQTLLAIRDLHRNGFIHRDIKPTHFCIGREEDDLHHQIFLIDFGFCKRPRFRQKKEGDYGGDFEEQMRKGTIAYRGCRRYASLAGHNGEEPGYKDDMESWWYMVFEFFAGKLPWSSWTKTDKKEVMSMKSKLNEQIIAQFWKIDAEALTAFVEILQIVRAPRDIADYVDYDKIAECIKTMVEKTKSNKLEPPDWDCMLDYKGPAYVPVVMTPNSDDCLQEANFAESTGGERMSREAESALERSTMDNDKSQKSVKSVRKSKSMKVIKNNNKSQMDKSTKSLKKCKSQKSIKMNKSSKSIKRRAKKANK